MYNYKEVDEWAEAKPSQAKPSQPSWVSKSIYIKASHSKFRCRLETCNYRIWYMIIFVRLKMPHHTSLTHTQLLKHQPNRWKPIIFSEKLFDTGHRLLVLYVIFVMMLSIYSKANTVYTFLFHACTLVMLKRENPFSLDFVVQRKKYMKIWIQQNGIIYSKNEPLPSMRCDAKNMLHTCFQYILNSVFLVSSILEIYAQCNVNWNWT